MSQLPIGSVKLPSRSLGIKFIVVCFLALLMTIPALLIWGLIDDRSQRAVEVTNEVSTLVGGPQTFLGPVIAIPYTIPGNATGATIADGVVTPIAAKPVEHGVYVVFPQRGDATADIKTEVRHRSLFKVPVYRSDISFRASFDLSGVPANAPEGAVLDWSRAEFLLGASDARGAQSDIALTVAGNALTLGPAAVLPSASVNLQPGGATKLAFFGASAAGVLRPGSKFDVSTTLKFSGAQQLTFLSFAKTTTIAMKGDWPDPSFNGSFLPASRTVSPAGFEATWAIPFLARGVAAEGTSALIARLGKTASGVSFVAVADAYQSVTRSLKYAVLFIGLVFLSYFLFEVSSGRRVHPAQYILIGIAQLVFYLLLLSFAERIGFDIAFLIAAVATVGLISAYAGWIFAGRKYGWRAMTAFSLLYGLIYILLRLEDEALLVGAIASFAAISAVMYFTRHMDWYVASAPAATVETGPATGAA